MGQGEVGITRQKVLEMHQKRAAMQESTSLAAPIEITKEIMMDR